MSLSWNGEKRMKPLTKSKKPSPIYQSKLQDSARNPNIIPNESKKCPSAAFGSVLSDSMEGISALVSYGRCVKGFGRFSGVTAGMTVEAAVVLPLLLFLFLNLGCAIEMIRLHGRLQLALWQTGRELSVYGYAADSGELPDDGARENAWWKSLGGIVLGDVYVKNKLIRLAGGEYLDRSPLAHGRDGLTLWESKIFDAGDIMDITVTYSVSPWSSLAAFPSFRMANRYYTHIWNGYELSGETEGKEEEARTVYVTAGGTVYHLYRDCTHLQLSVRPVPAGAIGEYRNENGGKYRTCDKCGTGSEGTVLYITAEGDCFHRDRDCSGLKRTVYTMKLADAAELRLCDRCGQRK